VTAYLLALAWAASALVAQPGRATVVRVQGPGGGEVAKAVARVLKTQGFRVIDEDEFRQSIIIMRAAPGDPAALAAVARQLNLAAYLSGLVSGRRKSFTVELAVHDLQNGSILARTAFAGTSARALQKAIAKGLWRRIGRTVVVEARRVADARVAPPAPPGAPPALAMPAAPIGRPRRRIDEDAPYTVAPAPPPLAPASPGPATTPAVFELTIGPRALYRQLSYDTDPDAALTPFRTRLPSPGLGVQAAWYPRLESPRLGLAGSLEYGAPLTTRTGADFSYSLPNSDVVGGVLVGWAWRYLTLDLNLGAGQHRFGVVPEGGAASRPRLIPDVTYRYLRAGLVTRVYTTSRFGVVAGAYYRHVLSAGLISSSDWFPGLRVHGVEATAGLTYRFLPSLEARLQGEARLYRMTSDPLAGGGHVTDGASDSYWSVWLAAAVLLGGAGERP
jgi:hypothetical protein